MSVIAEFIKIVIWSKVEIGNPSKRFKIICPIQLYVVSGSVVTSVDCMFLAVDAG